MIKIVLFFIFLNTSWSNTYSIATLSGGCFWGMEEIIRNLPGVINTTVGYSGGTITNPKYKVVKLGFSGHAESVQIEFDSSKISYEQLLEYFFRMHDPTTRNQQGNDKGSQYRSIIFYHNPDQLKIAKIVIDKTNRSKKWKNPIVTELIPSTNFYKAEEYHQKYLQKNPGGYTCHWLR